MSVHPRHKKRTAHNSTLPAPSKPMKRGKALERGRGPKAKSFSKRFPKDHDGPRYGAAFRAVRELPCWLATQEYVGPGHEACGLGQQGGHTAHHVGRNDEDGLIPCCGRAHDLYVGRGGRTAVRHFAAWMQRYGFTLRGVGRAYYSKVTEAP